MCRAPPIVVEGRTRTPSAHMTSRYRCTSSLERRNSGMPYCSTPPISVRCSKTVTAQPRSASLIATVIPAGPEPMTATDFPQGSDRSGSSRSR